MPQETEAAPGEPTEPSKTEITSTIVAQGQEPVLETRQVPDIRTGPPNVNTFATGAAGGFGIGRYSARKPKSE